MPRFSNRPFLGTTLSYLSSRAKPRDLRCAIRVPRTYRLTTATNHRGPLLETLNDKGEVGFSKRIR
jgi:hypothetical protein